MKNPFELQKDENDKRKKQQEQELQEMHNDSAKNPNLDPDLGLDDDEEEAQQKRTFINKSDNKHWAEIVEAFTKQYGKDKIEPDGALVFNSRDEAKSFFKQQAEGQPPKEFLTCEVDKNRKPTGHYMFSCGSGKMYEGANLADIKKQVEQDIEKSVNDTNLKGNDKLQQGLARLNTILTKEQLQQAKEEPKKDAPKNQDNLDTENPEESSNQSPGF